MSNTQNRHAIRVTFENGDKLTTEINGTWIEVSDYYLGKMFNLGVEKDNMQRATSIEFLKEVV